MLCAVIYFHRNTFHSTFRRRKIFIRFSIIDAVFAAKKGKAEKLANVK